MKKILLSIKPKWCEAILSGRKTIEVRKIAPKDKKPFKCYIYCTQGTFEITNCLDLNADSVKKVSDGRGKVIGEFICDKTNITTVEWVTQEELQKLCLTQEQLKNYSNKRAIYFWHISDLKIYDKPRDLSEFRIPCKTSCHNCKNPKYFDSGCEEKGYRKLTRPPQSWCFCEEIK